MAYAEDSHLLEIFFFFFFLWGGGGGGVANLLVGNVNEALLHNSIYQ